MKYLSVDVNLDLDRRLRDIGFPDCDESRVKKALKRFLYLSVPPCFRFRSFSASAINKRNNARMINVCFFSIGNNLLAMILFEI